MAVLPILRSDFSQERGHLYLKSKQYDNLSRKYKLVFTDNGIIRPVSESTLIRIRMWAESESSPYIDKYIYDPWEDNLPVLIFTSNMLSKVGKVKYEFALQEPGSMEIITTRQQNLIIQESLINYNGLIESDDFDVLSHLVAEASSIPGLIDDVNTTQEEVKQLITQIQTDISNYQSEFSEMQSDVSELIQSTQDYLVQLTSNVNITLNQANSALSIANQLINDAENTLTTATQKASEANDHALEAESLVHGGVVPEDTEDNAKFYYEQTKNLKEQVDTASKLVIPHFYINFETMELMSETEAKGMNFWVDNGDFYGEEVI